MSEILNSVTAKLAPNTYTTDAEIIAPHLVEWRDKYKGHTPLMLTPRTTQDVSVMVRACADAGLSIVPQGGNTGLVGGQTPMGEVLLSTRHLNKVRSVNPTTNSLVVEAGVTLQQVQDCAEKVDRKFPLSLASEGTCTVGGNLSTNAGGVHVLKYGTMKDLVFGVEAVLASGEIFNGLTNLRKDNTGYDVSRLFLGAEGTLGIITAASLKLFPRPAHTRRVMVGLPDCRSALGLLDMSQTGHALAMFEIIPRVGIELVTTHMPGQRDPFEKPYPWYALIDWEVDSEARGADLAEDVLARALARGLISDAVIAQSQSQAANLLALREHMSAAQKKNGASIKLDVTVPIDQIPDFLDEADAAVGRIVTDCRPVAFGHFGDGNIHYNVAQPRAMAREEFLTFWQDISEAVFDIIDRMEGSISAEHGIGVMKRGDLAVRADPGKMTVLRSVKTALDPNGLFNPRVLV